MVDRWMPEMDRYWFCRSGGHVLVADDRDEMPRCTAKGEYGEPCGGQTFGPLVMLADVSNWNDESAHIDGDDHE